MVNENIGSYSWQTLQDYIERRVAGLLDSLGKIDPDAPPDLAKEMREMAQRQLKVLNRSLPLVTEMQHRENMQVIIPIMSLDMIRLGCRQCGESQVRSADFAWITPIGEEIYHLVRSGFQETGEYGALWTFEGNLRQIVEKVEELVDELCVEVSL
jgi:hypothetical protein